MNRQSLVAAIPHALVATDLPGLGVKIEGKVRDIYVQGDRRILVTTDRVSAFDKVVAAIPFKGQVLNQLSAWWFDEIDDVVGNHVISIPDPNVTVAHEAQTLPVEVIVRGYITGVTSTSLWTLYEAGVELPYGLDLPPGLSKNDPLPEPVITPTTKASGGEHDERLTSEQVVSLDLVEAGLWSHVQRVALDVFARGQEAAADAGLILVDTKYEFGLVEGQLVLIDEVHTPDSSRYWLAANHKKGDPQNYDKEHLRLWLKARGYSGDGAPPEIPDEFVATVAERYIDAYERLTGESFVPGELPADKRIGEALR
ncbi:MAG TPA: phosphoribosylaminoimidazolesuccinocarboxamide synthase [Actinobacteria bacterium]|nr:phosphoribosylaminoimidazolesuccinocarboxamide synthase [Actinomycetota bacterium]